MMNSRLISELDFETLFRFEVFHAFLSLFNAGSGSFSLFRLRFHNPRQPLQIVSHCLER